MKEQIKNLKEEISLKLDNVSDLKDLNDLKVEYLKKALLQNYLVICVN